MTVKRIPQKGRGSCSVCVSSLVGVSTAFGRVFDQQEAVSFRVGAEGEASPVYLGPIGEISQVDAEKHIQTLAQGFRVAPRSVKHDYDETFPERLLALLCRACQ